MLHKGGYLFLVARAEIDNVGNSRVAQKTGSCVRGDEGDFCRDDLRQNFLDGWRSNKTK